MMNLTKNDYGYRIRLNESEKWPGTAFFDGEVVNLILQNGYTNCSIEISEQYGLSVNFRKPITKAERELL